MTRFIAIFALFWWSATEPTTGPMKNHSFFKFFIYLFIYFWLCWVFVSVRGLSLVAASGGHSSSLCAGLSLSRPLLLRSTSSRHAGSVVVAHGPSCSAARGILPDQGWNPCPLHWQADSQPLRHQGSPRTIHFEAADMMALSGYEEFPLFKKKSGKYSCISLKLLSKVLKMKIN